jgi:hypothetical protein
MGEITLFKPGKCYKANNDVYCDYFYNTYNEESAVLYGPYVRKYHYSEDYTFCDCDFSMHTVKESNLEEISFGDYIKAFNDFIKFTIKKLNTYEISHNNSELPSTLKEKKDLVGNTYHIGNSNGISLYYYIYRVEALLSGEEYFTSAWGVQMVIYNNGGGVYIQPQPMLLKDIDGLKKSKGNKAFLYKFDEIIQKENEQYNKIQDSSI